MLALRFRLENKLNSIVSGDKLRRSFDLETIFIANLIIYCSQNALVVNRYLQMRVFSYLRTYRYIFGLQLLVSAKFKVISETTQLFAHCHESDFLIGHFSWIVFKSILERWSRWDTEVRKSFYWSFLRKLDMKLNCLTQRIFKLNYFLYFMIDLSFKCHKKLLNAFLGRLKCKCIPEKSALRILELNKAYLRRVD